MTSDGWTLITVTYNCAVQLAESWTDVELDGIRWIVVDNASADDSVEVARALGAEVIRLDRNVGFSSANNIGLRAVTTGWVAFVNPDVTIRHARDLKRLEDVSLLNDCLIAPQLVNTDQSDQPNARGFPFILDKIANRSLRLPGSRLGDYVHLGLTRPTYAAWVMGAALAGRAEHFRRLSGWDERFFLYYEDTDIALRAWQAGIPVVVDPAVRWVHTWQRDTASLRWGAWKFELQSAVRFFRRHPSLVSRRNLKRSGNFAELRGLLWTDARDH